MTMQTLNRADLQAAIEVGIKAAEGYDHFSYVPKDWADRLRLYGHTVKTVSIGRFNNDGIKCPWTAAVGQSDDGMTFAIAFDAAVREITEGRITLESVRVV